MSPIDELAPIASGDFVFPQMADRGGYNTQWVLLSRGAGQSANGKIQFLSPTGQPITLSVR